MIDVEFFSSPIGLGHITRDVAIAKNFDNISTKFVTGSDAAQILKNSGFALHDVYNPPTFNVKNGILSNSAKWLWNYYQYYKNCKDISEKLFILDKPRIVVSDEDFASLSIAHNRNLPTILITDILKTRFTSGFASLIEKRMNNAMKKIIKNCKHVIIPELGQNRENIKYVGPIVRQTNHSREDLRKEFSFNKKTIVVSIGGTDAGMFLIQKTLELRTKLEECEIVIVSGPSLDKKFENVRNLGFIDNLHEVIYAADVVVSLAGKSTIDESKEYGTPGIFIPIKGHFEQEDNAKDEGFVFEDINHLEKLILCKLDEKRNPIHSQGTENASKIITELFLECNPSNH
jgi:UDP-N-acetylglucosamine--N-acetylmuramyl-(pentapeptide) pyrophosphoryl-undecaprenol N-acetylglucosamine transferase